MSKKKKIIIAVVLVLCVILICGALFAFGIMRSLFDDDLDKEKLSTNDKLDNKIMNVAVFGVDGREAAPGDRSDATMILSVNMDTGEIKIVSIMRDLLTRIPATEYTDVSYEKLNAAHSYGGSQTAIQALNENFDLNIKDYVTVNFEGLVDAVDIIGGVDINILNENILYYANKNIDDTTQKIPGIGEQHVNGEQALAYCRTRYADSDYGRTERQREVLVQIIKNALTLDLGSASELLYSVYPYVRTSLSVTDILSYYQAFKNTENQTIQTGRCPYNTIKSGAMINDISYVIPTTLADNVKVLHGYLYGEDNYQPSQTVLEISAQVEAISGMGSTVNWEITDWQTILNQQTTTDQR